MPLDEVDRRIAALAAANIPVKEIVRRTGASRNRVRRLMRSSAAFNVLVAQLRGAGDDPQAAAEAALRAKLSEQVAEVLTGAGLDPGTLAATSSALATVRAHVEQDEERREREEPSPDPEAELIGCHLITWGWFGEVPAALARLRLTQPLLEDLAASLGEGAAQKLAALVARHPDPIVIDTPGRPRRSDCCTAPAFTPEEARAAVRVLEGL